MATKALLCLLASFLLITTQATSKSDNDLVVEGYKTPAPAPPPNATAPSPVVKALPPPPAVKTPPPATSSTPPPAPAPSIKPPTPAPNNPPKTKEDCIALCAVRCKNHSRPNVCNRVCLTCCQRCKCVPPGQYGNREKCGKCYTDMTTRGGKPKCP